MHVNKIWSTKWKRFCKFDERIPYILIYHTNIPCFVLCSVIRVEQFITSFISYVFFQRSFAAKPLSFRCECMIGYIYCIIHLYINVVIHVMGSSSFIHLLSMFSCRYYKSMNAQKNWLKTWLFIYICDHMCCEDDKLWMHPFLSSSIIPWFKGLSHWSKLQL